MFGPDQRGGLGEPTLIAVTANAVSTQQRGTLIFARRAFWLGMFALHAVAVPAMWTRIAEAVTEGGWLLGLTRGAGFFASLLFFLLKVADVRWLRLRPGWRPATTAVLTVALLHGDPVYRWASGHSPADFEPVVVLFVVGGALECEVFRRAVGRLAQRINSLLRANHRHVGLSRGHTLYVRAESRLRLLIPFDRLVPRAPPVVA